MTQYNLLTLTGLVALALTFATVALAQDPLPSWNNGPTKQAIGTFVENLTKETSPDFVSPAEREYAYSAESKIGTSSNALMAEASKQGWTVISMKNDPNRIFPEVNRHAGLHQTFDVASTQMK